MPGFDEVAQVYDATRSLRPEVMAKVVEGIVQFMGNASLVDFGVGTGRFASPLVRSGIDVTGLDISPQMLAQARSKGITKIALAAAEFVPFKSSTFDFAMAVHVMHLVSDWRTVVREMARVARKGLITLFEDQETAHPRDLYLHLREARGFKMPGLKRGERDLVSMVKPSHVRRLVGYRDSFDPAAQLREYSAKLHTITWDLPDHVNDEIVEEMRARLGEKRDLDRSATLVVWNHEQIRAFDQSP